MSRASELSIKSVIKKLNKEATKINVSGARGVTEALLYVRNESQALTPVVEGNLRGSAFIVMPDGRNSKAGAFVGENAGKLSSQHAGVVGETQAKVKTRREISGSVGYSAVYALATHENKRAGKTGGKSPKGVEYTAGTLPSGRKSTRKVWSTVGQHKFLETPLKRTKVILSLISGKMKI